MSTPKAWKRVCCEDWKPLPRPSRTTNDAIPQRMPNSVRPLRSQLRARSESASWRITGRSLPPQRRDRVEPRRADRGVDGRGEGDDGEDQRGGGDHAERHDGRVEAVGKLDRPHDGAQTPPEEDSEDPGEA